MKIPILFENFHAVIIDKPAGIMVHPDGRQSEYTIADWVKDTYKVLIGDEGREGIVHRLDRNTTGVLVLAKDNVAYTSFKKQFKDHTVRKVYRAIVEGHIRNDTGMISLPIARARSDFRKRTVVDMFAKDQRGEERDAITRYKVLERSLSPDGKHYSYVEVYPVTGRTHQIRAHFRGIRHSILGDDLYGSFKGKNEAPRSMLHAYSITLEVPLENAGKEKMTIISPIPKDMKASLKALNFKGVD
ncbi:MAG: hypothetical protein JWN37_106 [Candidatus Nomurabacteria bacterium]|nr:hypothetical protein [Candidatus Nomurabacteria bacterium]